jgi:hypothetical protein
MRDSNMRIVLPLVIASLLPGCTHNPAPKAWRPPPAEAQHNSRGAWTVVESLASEAQSQDVSYVEGELIAVDDDAFHVLAATGLRSVSRSSPYRITIVGYGSSTSGIAIWASAGGASTLSHGALLIFTAPMWVIAGFVAAASERGAGVFKDDDLARAFSRFPQGLPSQFDPESLGPLVGNPDARGIVPRR